MKAYTKANWIELIDFNNTHHDMGVEYFLSKTKWIPNVVILLLYSNDFVHSHSSLLDDKTMLRQDCSSYSGRLYGIEHNRQQWTKGQLKLLISNLQKQGIEVFFSIFDQLMEDEYGKEFIKKFQLCNMPSAWTDNHLELRYVDKNGQMKHNAIYPYKRLKDGTFYEDFFITKLKEVLIDYNFDGFHGADGYIHQRYNIGEADFSDDMVEQSKLPVAQNCDSNPTKLTQRAKEILTKYRREWMDFHTARHEIFWEKCAAMLKSIQRKLVLNTIWTRDPMEARYRYGADYRTFAKIKPDAVILEAPGTVCELENWWDKKTRPVYGFMVALLRIVAIMPHTPIWYMNGLKDTLEQYDAVAHAPMELEAELELLNHAFIFTKTYKYRHALNGVLATLSSLSAEQWQWVTKRWDRTFKVSDPTNFHGAMVLWSNRLLDNELADYATGDKRFISSFKIHTQLLVAHAPVNGIIDIKDLDDFSGTLVVINGRFLPEDERQKVEKYSGKIVYCEAHTCNSRLLIPDPLSWLEALPEPELDTDLLKNWITQIAKSIQIPQIMIGEGHIFETAYTDNNTRITIVNDKNFYQHIGINFPAPPKTLNAISNYDFPIDTSGGTQTDYNFKLPPHGVVIIEGKR